MCAHGIRIVFIYYKVLEEELEEEQYPNIFQTILKYLNPLTSGVHLKVIIYG